MLTIIKTALPDDPEMERLVRESLDILYKTGFLKQIQLMAVQNTMFLISTTGSLASLSPEEIRTLEVFRNVRSFSSALEQWRVESNAHFTQGQLVQHESEFDDEEDDDGYETDGAYLN